MVEKLWKPHREIINLKTQIKEFLCVFLAINSSSSSGEIHRHIGEQFLLDYSSVIGKLLLIMTACQVYAQVDMHYDTGRKII